MQEIAGHAGKLAAGLDWVVVRLCALIAAVLVLDVWLGVFVRFVWPLPITWTEELARYLMIWLALLAASSGIARRAHIGVEIVPMQLPVEARRWLRLALDIVAFAFFASLVVYGAGFAAKGFERATMIPGWSHFVPFLSVPVSALLCCIQLVLVAIRDLGAAVPPADATLVEAATGEVPRP
ncbi:MAG: TRAP transporter small permease [Geminicoccaceae bacterium]